MTKNKQVLYNVFFVPFHPGHGPDPGAAEVVVFLFLSGIEQRRELQRWLSNGQHPAQDRRQTLRQQVHGINR